MAGQDVTTDQDRAIAAIPITATRTITTGVTAITVTAATAAVGQGNRMAVRRRKAPQQARTARAARMVAHTRAQAGRRRHSPRRAMAVVEVTHG